MVSPEHHRSDVIGDHDGKHRRESSEGTPGTEAPVDDYHHRRECDNGDRVPTHATGFDNCDRGSKMSADESIWIPVYIVYSGTPVIDGNVPRTHLARPRIQIPLVRTVGSIGKSRGVVVQPRHAPTTCYKGRDC